MEARIVRENLSKCQKIEGVNHYERCKDLAERYTDMLKDSRVRVLHSFTSPNPRPDSVSQVVWFYVDVC